MEKSVKNGGGAGQSRRRPNVQQQRKTTHEIFKKINHWNYQEAINDLNETPSLINEIKQNGNHETIGGTILHELADSFSSFTGHRRTRINPLDHFKLLTDAIMANPNIENIVNLKNKAGNTALQEVINGYPPPYSTGVFSDFRVYMAEKLGAAGAEWDAATPTDWRPDKSQRLINIAKRGYLSRGTPKSTKGAKAPMISNSSPRSRNSSPRSRNSSQRSRNSSQRSRNSSQRSRNSSPGSDIPVPNENFGQE